MRPSVLERGREVLADGALDLCVVGGCGRAGLPLALAFARAGLAVGIYDIDARNVELVRSGTMPFMEQGADELLGAMLATGKLDVSTDPRLVARTSAVIVIVGTPIDEFLNPSMTELAECVETIAPHVRPKSLVILRSTVFPGSTEWLHQAFRDRNIEVDVAMCPERITEGFALEELSSLPQIVGADVPGAGDRAETLFRCLAAKTIRTTTREAELAKLFTNAWRYMKFAVANHFFMVANTAGLDYGRILRAIREDYPRASDLPGPGFAAGPCLLKDTMQLAAFGEHELLLAQAAMVVNEGLPNYILRQMERRTTLRGKTIGILGMAFKKDNDDARASLSYKLRKLLIRSGAVVMCTDPYLIKDGLSPLEEVLRRAEILIVGAPHSAYRKLDVAGKDVIDVWGALGPIRV